MPTKIFITGVSGYIGGAVLDLLLKQPDKYTVTALVRSKEQAETLRKLGVTPLLGSLDDSEILIEASKNADAVIDTANVDHLASTQAIIKGLKAKNDKKAVLLRTSGTAILAYDPVTKEHFDDMDIARIHSIPSRALHREMDAYFFDNIDGITGAIICPSTINGVSKGPFKKHSQQFLALAKASKKRKQTGFVGPRTDAVWPNVHIDDLADLYILVLEGLLKGSIPQGKEGGWYFGVADEHVWRKFADVMAEVLKKKGLVENTNVTPFEQEYVDEFLFGQYASNVFGNDSKAVANRSKSIGWKPHRPNAYATLEEEIDYTIKNGEL